MNFSGEIQIEAIWKMHLGLENYTKTFDFLDPEKSEDFSLQQP